MTQKLTFADIFPDNEPLPSCVLVQVKREGSGEEESRRGEDEKRREARGQRRAAERKVHTLAQSAVAARARTSRTRKWRCVAPRCSPRESTYIRDIICVVCSMYSISQLDSTQLPVMHRTSAAFPSPRGTVQSLLNISGIYRADQNEPDRIETGG